MYVQDSKLIHDSALVNILNIYYGIGRFENSTVNYIFCEKRILKKCTVKKSLHQAIAGPDVSKQENEEIRFSREGSSRQNLMV